MVKLPQCAWCAKPFYRTDLSIRSKKRGVAVRRKGCLTCCKICSRRRIEHRARVGVRRRRELHSQETDSGSSQRVSPDKESRPDKKKRGPTVRWSVDYDKIYGRKK